MTARVRHRQVSPQRVARIAAEMKRLGLSWTIKLGTDGSVLLTDSGGDALTPPPEDDAADQWAKLGIQ